MFHLTGVICKLVTAFRFDVNSPKMYCSCCSWFRVAVYFQKHKDGRPWAWNMKKGHIAVYISLRCIESFDPGITMCWADVDPIMAMWAIKAKIATDPLHRIPFEFNEHSFFWSLRFRLVPYPSVCVTLLAQTGLGLCFFLCCSRTARMLYDIPSM